MLHDNALYKFNIDIDIDIVSGCFRPTEGATVGPEFCNKSAKFDPTKIEVQRFFFQRFF